MVRVLTVELEAAQFAQLQAEAERWGISPSDLAGKLLAEHLPLHEEHEIDRRAWLGLSAPSFARDWESDEDQAYDRLS